MLDYVRSNRREVIAGVVLVVLLAGYIGTHPRGASTYVMTIWANQGLILGLAACAQFFAVVVRGIDLSVGAIMALTNCIASYLLDGSALGIGFGMFAVVAAGAACGLLNGVIIVYGRLQPIVVTLATASIFVGIALLLRPTPGGAINYDLADAITLDVLGIPTALIITGVVIMGFWLPFRRTGLGLGLYALGSSEQAAFQSGINTKFIRLAAFTLAGFFGGLAGLYYCFVTTTGYAGIAPGFCVAALVLWVGRWRVHSS